MSDGLTYDKLLETYRSIPKVPPPMRVFEVPLYAVKVQARRHPRKKRRLQKKWLTRYGYRTEYKRHFELGQMLVDESRGVVYAHREEIEAMKRQLGCLNCGHMPHVGMCMVKHPYFCFCQGVEVST